MIPNREIACDAVRDAYDGADVDELMETYELHGLSRAEAERLVAMASRYVAKQHEAQP